MKKLKRLNFFGHEGLYVVDDQIDAESNCMVYLLEELSMKYHQINCIDKIDNDTITLRDFKDRTFKRADIIRILGKANIPKRVESMFKEGDEVEIGESWQSLKSKEDLIHGDICHVPNRFGIVEIQNRDEKDENAFICKTLYVHELGQKYKERALQIHKFTKIIREDLMPQPTYYVNLKCKCCGMEIR